MAESIFVEQEFLLAEEAPVVRGNTPEEEEAVRICADWFEKDRAAKQFYVDEMEEMDKLYRGDHWDLIGPAGTVLRTTEQKKAHPNAVENISFALVEGLVAEFSQDVDIVFFPTEPGDDEAADVLTDLVKWIAYKNKIETERQHFLRHLFKYGTGIWHVYWDPTWRGGRGPNRWIGDVRWTALHPQFFFPDARCRLDVNEGIRCHKAVYRTLEYIRSKYPERGHLVAEEMVDVTELVGEDYASETREEQALLVETWYKGRPLILGPGEEDMGEGLHVIWWAGEGQRIYLRHANYVYFEPGEDPVFPFIVRQCYPRENSIWGYSEIHFIKSPQINLNKTAEMILEGHMHHAVGQTFFAETALSDRQRQFVERYGSLAGMWFPVRDPNGIKREHGTGVPASLVAETTRLQKVMETIVGRFDISQGRTPTSVTAFRALDLLAARAQVRLRSKEVAVTSAYSEVGQYIARLILQFYTERRAYRILGADRPSVQIFELDRFRKAYLYHTGEAIPLALFVPHPDWVEGQDYEIYAPEFDVICKTSTTLPSDRLFFMEMAKELFGANLIDAETFWYVMSRGKFPPFEELMQKEAEKRLAEAQPPAAVPAAGPIQPLQAATPLAGAAQPPPTAAPATGGVAGVGF